MEIIKTVLNQKIIKIELGTEFNEETKVLSGQVELDIENQSQFINLINIILEEGKSLIIVDMTHVSYIDSSGLWALFEGHKKASQKNGKLVILKPTKDVRRVLDITKMSSKMDIFEDEQAALRSLHARI